MLEAVRLRLRHVRPGIARHRGGAARIARDRARRRVRRLAELARGRLRIARPGPPSPTPPTASGSRVRTWRARRAGRTPDRGPGQAIRVARSIPDLVRDRPRTSARPNTCSVFAFSIIARLPGLADAGGRRRARRCLPRRWFRARRPGRCFPSPGRGAARDRRHSPGSRRAAPRPARPPRRARARRGTAGTAADRWRPPLRGRRGRSPIRLTVARRLPAATPRMTSGAPIRAASRAHWRQLAGGTERLISTITSAVFGRAGKSPLIRPALRLGRERGRGPGAGSGRGCRPAGPFEGAPYHVPGPLAQPRPRRPCAAPRPRHRARNPPATAVFPVRAKPGSTPRDRARRPGQGRCGMEQQRWSWYRDRPVFRCVSMGS